MTFDDDRHKKRFARNKSNPAAKHIADLVGKFLDPVIERRAGMTMDLIATWDHIAGDPHHALSRPEKLSWPGRDAEEFEPATLLVACESTHVLFMQHDSDQIIERINAYFGFYAVGRLKFVQKPVSQQSESSSTSGKHRPTVRDLDAKRSADLEHILSQVSDPELKAALEKLGAGVFRNGSSRNI